jgi:hypothetical protein
MAGLDPAIHLLKCAVVERWMPGSRPGMTTEIFDVYAAIS